MKKLEICELVQLEQSFNKIPAFNEYSFFNSQLGRSIWNF